MKKIYLLAAACCCFAGSALAQNNDVGLWTELEVSKELPKNFEVGLEGELRTRDHFSHTDRLGLTFNLGYKPTKFLKLQLGYALMNSYKSEETKVEEVNIFTKKIKETEDYWTLRHRLKADIVLDKKFFKCIKLTLRERYQYTYRPEIEVPRMVSEYYKDMLKPDYPISDPDKKHERRDHILRSRLEAEWDKKKCDWSPFVSFEFYNDLTQQMYWNEYKVMAGSGYKLSKNHKIKLSYMYNMNREEHPYEARHAIIAGFSYKF